MPNLNANVHVDRAGTAPQTGGVGQGANQSVGVNWSEEAQQAVDVTQGGGEGESYQYSGEQGYQQQQDGGADSGLSESVSRDLGALTRSQEQPERQQVQQQSRQQEQQQQQQQQSRKIHTNLSDAVAMGMRTSEQQRRTTPTESRIPVVNMEDVELPTASSRSDVFDKTAIHDALAESGAQIISARDNSRGSATPAMPSRLAVESVEQRRPKARDAARSKKATKPNNENAPAEQVAAQSTEPPQPTSIFNRSFGYNKKDRKARTKQASTKRHPSLVKAIQRMAKNAFGNSGVGYRIYGKMNGLPSLDLRDVGVGVQEIMNAIRQNADMVNRLFAPFMEPGENVARWSSDEVVEFVRTHEIYVATFKEPGNRGPDAQRRRLRVLTTQQRGIYLHPIMAALYTADFDGDDMEVSLDPNVAKLTRDPMSYMIDIDGKQTLNVDFLPVSRIVDGYEEGKTARDYVRDEILGKTDLSKHSDFRYSISSLIDAILELSKTATKDGDAQAVAWGNLFMTAREVADQTGENSDAIMSQICHEVYQAMKDIGRQISYSSIDADIIGMDKLPDPVAFDDSAIYLLIREMVVGEVPNNFQDLKIMLSGFLGNVKGKNAPFRFTADVGKMMKMDTRLQIGDGSFVVDPNDVEQMKSFFESTVKYAESQRMAQEVKKAGRSQYYTQLMRERVISEVGFPERYESYAQFLNAFCVSYNHNSAKINEANLVRLTNYGIASDSNRGLVSPLKPSPGGVTLGDLAEPIRSIYGDYSVGRMFGTLSESGIMGEHADDFFAGNPNAVRRAQKRSVEREYDYEGDARFWITGKYLNRSINEFIHENRLIRGDTGIEEIRGRKVDALLNKNNVDAEFEMLLALADKRTSTASQFNKSVYGKEKRDKSGKKYIDHEGTTVKMMADLLSELRRLDTDGTVSGRRDQMLWVNDVIETLVASGPDMFLHFNMDSTAGFLQSEWAKKMVEYADNPEVLGGIRTAMVFNYRMERIDDLISKLPDPDSDVDEFNMDQRMDAFNNLEFARDELSAASEVWRGIIKEFRAEESSGQESVFQMMRNGSLLQTGPNGRKYAWDIKRDAGSFWSNPGSHMTLRSVIEDLDLDRQTKWNVIADVVRYWENDAYLKSYEVGFQLEIGNDSSYSLGSSASQRALGAHRDFEKAFNRWGKMSQENLQKEVDDAFDRYGKKRGLLMRTLQRLDSSPWELVAIDDMMYADSILSVKDKTYAQTEKASQHPWTNAIYAALSFQRNGGYMNDITRTDDRLLGLVSVDAIGISDVIHILADPEADMWVYNQYGEIGQVTRDILLQGALGREASEDIERDIWDLLRKEPRIASAIRMHNACVKTNTEGDGYLGSMLSLGETLERFNGTTSNPLDHVRYLMRDHPVYAAIISMASPGLGSVTRNERNRINEIDNYLVSQIYNYASSDMSAEGSATAILSDLGITKESIFTALRSNYDYFLELCRLPIEHGEGETEEDATTTYNTAAEYMTHYIMEVRDNVQLGSVVAQDMRKPKNIGVDVSSVASFWDVVQELGGAKTNVSTGIEGYETFQFGEWASHISARDKFADLEAVFEDVTPEWNGMWTSMRNPDGSPILLQVDENGSITNYRQIMLVKKDQKASEVVINVPVGYEVRDRSTDSHGNPVASLFVYMVSKRSNGAEAFNLKAKKAGLDGKDSVIKMQGKYRMVNDQGTMRRASFFEIQRNLQQLAQQNGENGLMIAKNELAIMMMQENAELGYDDMTLANYMCLADLMLIEDADGVIHLRSLEMLFSAIKHRLGSSIDEMTDEEIINAADQIVNDTSEDGVGIAEMSGVEAFDNIRPMSKSSSFNGIRSNSSVFARNYDLLDAIEKDASMNGIKMMSQARAEQLNERYTGRRGVDGIKNIVGRCSMTRGYSVVGYSGVNGAERKIDWTIGPSHMVVIGEGDITDNEVIEICEMCYGLGMTVLVGAANRNKIPSTMLKDAMPCSDAGDVVIPCFDMRLNGAESTPYNGGRFSIFQAPFSRYVVSVEDSINEYELGDAQVKVTRNFVDRIKNVENGSRQIRAEDMFPNVFRNPAFKDCLFSVSLASGDDVRNLIAQGVRCTIDYGIVEGGHGFAQRKHDVDNAIKRYQSRWSEADPDGFIRGDMTECVPGDIVGWAGVEIRNQYTGDTQYVLAPIIPFPLHGPVKGVPEKFSVQQVCTVDNDNTLFAVDWSNTSEISNGFAKYFDSSGGANKGMVDFTDAVDAKLMLRDGTMVDAYIAKASTDSRKIGTDRRVKTMITLMAKARMRGYNFARSEGAFPSSPNHPENEDIRERLLHKRIPASEWRSFLNAPGGVLFTTDPKLNAFLNYECAKILFDGGNPSDYLANVFTDSEGVEHNTHVMWEFEAMFDKGIEYENSLLQFLHFMDPTFCPNGIDDTGEYLFRLSPEDGYNRGVLQMQVPHRYSNGSVAYLWDNVYIGMSFFGEDYSGFSRPNVDGASNFLDAMNTMSYYGKQLDEKSARFRAMWATADIGRVPRDGGAYGR